MAGDELSQAERETLLNRVELGAASAADVRQPAVAISSQSARASRSREAIPSDDARRPSRLNKEQMRALERLHKEFARSFGVALSALLRSAVDFKLTSLDQLSYREFILRLENPTCFNLLRANPLEGNLILDMNPSILYPIIDRLLGGGREPVAVARRPLTGIELRLVARITALGLQELRRAWSNVVELALSVERVESVAQLAPAVAAHEPVVLIRFDVGINDARGAMHLCLPNTALERIAGKLSDQLAAGHGPAVDSGQAVRQLGKGRPQSTVELVAELAETTITADDLQNLHVGDIITTEKDIHSPIAVCLDGVPRFHAQAGAFQGHKAIRVDDLLADAENGALPAGDG
jgi:flagellar motor switch protein FliM